MDYIEMIFALEVRKMAISRMKKEAIGSNEDSKKIFDTLDYEKYVKSVISDIKTTALIIKSELK